MRVASRAHIALDHGEQDGKGERRGPPGRGIRTGSVAWWLRAEHDPGAANIAGFSDQCVVRRDGLHAGHVAIRHDELDPNRLERAASGGRMRHPQHVVACGAEHHGQQVPRGVILFNH